MTNEEARKIGRWNALVALDAGDVEAGRDNLIDTMNDNGLAEFVNIALMAYDSYLNK